MTRPNASRTIDRIANMRRLIAELHKGDMPRNDMLAFLGLARSTVRSMLDDLTAGEVVARVGRLDTYPGSIGVPVYRLTGDSEKVERCLANIEQGGGRRQGVSRDQAAILARDPARHVHVMRDDEPFRVRICRAAVMPDPWALPRPFFGVAGRAAG